ncbi:DUF637 domain-containing protein [Bibersteinia trehalosi]|nr:DUF637 domain-containing protein [Bibersteinia trehalosi]
MIQGAYTGIGSQQLIFPSLKKHLNGVSSVSLPNGARVESGRTEEHLALPTFNCGKPVFNVAGGIVVDMPKGKLRNELETLLKKPEYAYLKNLKLNDNVQWKEVSLAYQQWDYKQQGLTGAGAAIIALAMAVVTAGAGAAAIGLAASSAYAPIANAAFTALTTQATTSLVNNRGNLNQTFKDLGSSQQAKQFVTAVVSAGVADKLANTVNVNSGNLYLDKFSQNLIQAGSTATVQTAINGGKFTKALENAIYTALIDTAHAELAKNIKGIKSQADANKWYREAAHKIAHAVAGCGAAAGRGGKCTDGALGAALGEVVGEWLLNGRDPAFLPPKEKEDLTNKSKLIVGSVSAVTGGDVDSAAKSAETAIKNNLLFVPVMIALAGGGYAYYVGDGDLSEGLYLIGNGNDPISQTAAKAGDVVVGFAMDTAPETTKSILNALSVAGNKVDAVIRYVDDKTGNIVSQQWNKLDDNTQKQLIGTMKIVNVTMAGTGVANLRNIAGNSKKLSPREMERITKSYYDIDVLKNIREQLNDDRRMKNLVLPLSNRVVNPIEELSRGAAVYKGVSEKEVKALFMRLSGVNKLPEVKYKELKSGKKGAFYNIKTKDGDSITLRNFSSSEKETKAKWTIQIDSKSTHNIEIKFQ